MTARQLRDVLNNLEGMLLDVPFRCSIQGDYEEARSLLIGADIAGKPWLELWCATDPSNPAALYVDPGTVMVR